jgi:hypothetical protein
VHIKSYIINARDFLSHPEPPSSSANVSIRRTGRAAAARIIVGHSPPMRAHAACAPDHILAPSLGHWGTFASIDFLSGNAIENVVPSLDPKSEGWINNKRARNCAH